MRILLGWTIEDNNPILWHMVQQSAEISGDPRL